MSLRTATLRSDPALVLAHAALALVLAAGLLAPRAANAQLASYFSSTTSTTTTTTSLSTDSTSASSTYDATQITPEVLADDSPATPVARECTEDEKKDILAKADDDHSSIPIDCSFSFAPPQRITKQLVFTGDTRGVTVDCNGGVIDGGPGSYHYNDPDPGANIVEIVSSLSTSGPVSWESRPQDITIRHCKIVGSARIWPLNVWHPENMERLAAFSREPGYVSKLRALAPRDVRFERIVFEGLGTTPLYIGPGVTETTVVNSRFQGGAAGVALYLDAESSRNSIRNNVFDIETDLGKKPREIIAIDGSDRNQIVGNYFSALDHGGIELYRNCGEDRIVRFTTPSHNHIINNVFYYDKYDGDDAAVVLGSRDGKSRPYCGDDSDFGAGSGTDNRSFATHNVVMQNQFYKRSVAKSVKTKWTDVNVPNYVAYNETVRSHVERPSGCYVEAAYGQFLRDGETTRLRRSSSGAPSCDDQVLRCEDGELRLDPESLAACEIERIPFSCRVSGSNRGCTGSSMCPSGTTRVRAVAACNLEYGAVTDFQLDAIPGNSVRVVRASDSVSDGSCFVDSNSVRSGEAIIENDGYNGRVYFGCSERDSNGGDCHVRGELYCEDDSPPPAYLSETSLPYSWVTW
jgi:hypothetical protein